jgi:hypothetical protein
VSVSHLGVHHRVGRVLQGVHQRIGHSIDETTVPRGR